MHHQLSIYIYSRVPTLREQNRLAIRLLNFAIPNNLQSIYLAFFETYLKDAPIHTHLCALGHTETENPETLHGKQASTVAGQDPDGRHDSRVYCYVCYFIQLQQH